MELEVADDCNDDLPFTDDSRLLRGLRDELNSSFVGRCHGPILKERHVDLAKSLPTELGLENEGAGEARRVSVTVSGIIIIIIISMTAPPGGSTMTSGRNEYIFLMHLSLLCSRKTDPRPSLRAADRSGIRATTSDRYHQQTHCPSSDPIRATPRSSSPSR